jgi:signal transduction histidine kinase
MTHEATNTESSIDTLRQRLLQREADIEALRLELDETNRGVVALYAELDDRAVQLREAMDLKGRFLSYMSHEFRTPLTSITSLTNILLARLDGPLTAEQEHQVELVRGSVRELTEMVDDLLDLARVEAGRITISPEWFEMVDLFSALRGMFKPIVASTGVSLVFEEPKNVPRIYTDDKKLSQILRNFISNALKYTMQGSVVVSAQFKEPDRVLFTVRDTGIGIAKDDLARLAKPFEQIESQQSKTQQGTGLGLALSKSLIEMHGGVLEIESTPGVGTTVSFLLPVRQGRAYAEERGAAAA